MMEFELLRSFVAVAECGGFHRAAERLNLTQSTVSQQIKRLELETNRPLFRRTTRTVALTDDGEMLLGDARRLLQFEEAARHRLAELIEQLNAGRLDTVFAKRPLGTSKGRLVWREPLVWVAADTFDLVPGAALPLALYRERSVSREAALPATRNTGFSSNPPFRLSARSS